MTNPQVPITTRNNLKEKWGIWQLKSTHRHSTVQPSRNTSTSQLLITAVNLLVLQSQLLYIRSSTGTPYTRCPSVNRVTASDLPLNDSEGCPSSLLTLLTLLGFIINDTLSAGYSNMQDLQTSVWMNTLLSQCLDHHLPRLQLAPSKMTPHYIQKWPHAPPVDHSKLHRDPVLYLTQTAVRIGLPLIYLLKADRPLWACMFL